MSTPSIWRRVVASIQGIPAAGYGSREHVDALEGTVSRFAAENNDLRQRLEIRDAAASKALALAAEQQRLLVRYLALGEAVETHVKACRDSVDPELRVALAAVIGSAEGDRLKVALANVEALGSVGEPVAVFGDESVADMPMVRRFRKKPVVVEAMRNSGLKPCVEAIRAWMTAHGCEHKWAVDGEDEKSALWSIEIPTLEGTMLAAAGDWVIRGVAGEFYPCKPEIFAKSYETADEP